jgi:hypothetical protein
VHLALQSGGLRPGSASTEVARGAQAAYARRNWGSEPGPARRESTRDDENEQRNKAGCDRPFLRELTMKVSEEARGRGTRQRRACQTRQPSGDARTGDVEHGAHALRPRRSLGRPDGPGEGRLWCLSGRLGGRDVAVRRALNAMAYHDDEAERRCESDQLDGRQEAGRGRQRQTHKQTNIVPALQVGGRRPG